MGNKGSSKNYEFVAAQYNKERDYWLNKLSGELVKISFPYDKNENRDEFQFKKLKFKFTGQLFSRLLSLSNDSNFRLHMIMVAGLVALLNRYNYNNNKDIIVGAPTYRQDVKGELINTVLALRNRIDDDMTFKELLLQTGQTTFEANENQNYPIETLLFKLNLPVSGNDFPLFDIIVLVENIHDKSYLEGINTSMVLSFNRKDECMEGELKYNSSRYKKTTIEGIIRHFTNLLQEAVFKIDLPLIQIGILSKEEQSRLLIDFNDNKANFSRDKTVYRLIEAQAEVNAHRTALVYKESQLTYQHVNKRANQLAILLRNYGIRSEEPAAILLNRSHSMIESILAVWKVGGTYMPVDPQYPVQRISLIFGDSGTRFLITRGEYVVPGLEEHFDGKIIKLDQQRDDTRKINPKNLNLEMDMNNLAYIIYTSGSTGKPKAAAVEHIGMMNHIQAKIRDIELSAESIVAQDASHTFDISIWQFFSALALGGKTIIYPDKLILEPERFISGLIDHMVTILEVVPSYMAVMLETISLMKPAPILSALQYLLVTGEEIKPPWVKKWFDIFPGIKMVNAYGPTEASDDITHFIMDKAPDPERIPIGKPIQNFNIYIVDTNMKLCPIGVKGEICVSGLGVGRGYMNNVEKTMEVFMDNPFRNVKKEGRRLYKTGDLGCWLPGGVIEFFGRKDHQVKIRGYRIELGEIECKIAAHPTVDEVCVIDKEGKDGNMYLCAYVIPTPNHLIAFTPLKEYLSKYLPGYMIPTHFIPLERMPLTPNGKIDRNQLPEPGTDKPPSSSIRYISESELNQLKLALNNKSHPSASSEDIPGKENPDENNQKFLWDSRASEEKLFQRLSLDGRKQSGKPGTHFYPLTHPQKMIYFSGKKYPGTAAQNLAHLVSYSRQLDRDLLEQAINIVINKNDDLRLKIVEIEYEGIFTPAQYIANHKELRLDYYDFSGKSEKELQEWININTCQPFNLIDSNLFYFAYIKINETDSGYYMNLHHIISDQWACFLLFTEIDKILNELEQGKTIDDTPNPSYLQYIPDERDYLNSRQAKVDREFWLKNLLPLPEEVYLSSIENDQENCQGNVCYLAFPAVLRKKMHEYCKSNKTSIYKLILAALSIYISKAAASSDFVIGSLNHNRSTDIHKIIVGAFIRFIPLRIKVEYNKNFHDFVSDLGKNLNCIVKNHQKYPFDILINELREKTGADLSYFFNINLIGHPDLNENNFNIQRPFQGYEVNPLTIHINRFNKDIHGILEMEWVYRVNCYTESDLKRIHQSLVDILKHALANPMKKLADLGKDVMIVKTGKPAKRIPDSKTERTNIENLLMKHEEIADALVVDRSGETGDKYRCAFITTNSFSSSVPGNSPNPVELRKYLLTKLPAYTLPSYFVQLERIPLTHDGKKDRNILKEIDIKRGRNAVKNSPENEVEEKLAAIWGGVLGIEEKNLGIDENFFQLGGHSLKAIMLTSKTYKELHVKIPLAEIFKTPTIRGLARYVKETVQSKFKSIRPQEQRYYYPLSSAQKRLYILTAIDLESTNYNTSTVVELEGILNKTLLENVFGKLVQRHASFRTSFELLDGEPVQKIHDQLEFKIEYYNTGREENLPGIYGLIPGFIKKFIRPFHLSQVPLLRVGLIEIEKQKHLLMMDMHHIIIDGVSRGILIQEIMDSYGGKELSPLNLNYKDYAVWQDSEAQKELLKKQEAYWLKKFAAIIPGLNLPMDFPRPAQQSIQGKSLDFILGKPLVNKLKVLAAEEKATMYMVLLALFNVLLSRISGQEDIIIGTDAAGRTHVDLENLIGLFVNTLAMRNYPSREKTFRKFLREAKLTVLEAFENQDYPFENLVDKLSISRDASRNPLFDVMFSVNNIEYPEIKLPGLTLSLFDDQSETTKFDLILSMVERGDQVFSSFGYCTKLFKKETIVGFIRYFKEIVSSVVKNPDARLGEIEIISEEEKKHLLRRIREEEKQDLIEGMETGQEASRVTQAEFDF